MLISELVELRQRIVKLESSETERRQVEEALQRSEERYRSLYTKTPAMLHSIDKCGRLVDVSDHWLEVFGYERKEVIGRKSTEFLTHESRHYAETVTLPEFMKTGMARNVPYQFVGKNGQIVDVLLSAIAECDEGGTFIRSLAVLDDVTDRKVVEEALRVSEERLRAFAGTLPDLAFILDEDGLYVEVLTAAEDLLYKEADQLKGRLLREVLPKESADLFLKTIRNTIESEKSQVLEYLLDVQAGPRWFEGRTSPLRLVGADKKMVVWVSRDITERKRAEEALQESEDRFRSFFEKAASGIAIVSPDFQFSDVNAAFCEFLGYTKSQLVKLTIADVTHPEDWDENERQILQTLEERSQYIRAEKRYLRKDGTFVWGQVSAAWIRDANSNPLYAVALVQDITSRKKAEEELKASREQLRSLFSYLENVREEERRRIAREIHDELAQTLTALKMDAFWLKTHLRADQKSLRETVDSMSGLIDETIHSVQRISAELRPRLLDDLGLVAAIEWQTQQFKIRTEIVCEVLIDADEVSPAEDVATHIFRILQEALTNVARHASATAVEVSFIQHDDELVLKIEDNGKGIAKHQILDSASIGLIGMRERVRILGGNVQILGVPGEGTTVTVKIPYPKD